MKKDGPDWKNKIYNRSSYNFYINKGIESKDINTFIAIIIIMGIHKLSNLHSYWNKYFVFSNRIPEIMSRDYFLLILKPLHLPENSFNILKLK